MRSFKDHNPIAIFLFYAFTTIPAMFCLNPVLLLISMAAAISYRLVSEGAPAIRKMLVFMIFPIAGAIINPLFVHNGSTNLFILNNNPVTLESVMYGLTAGIMIFATITWFSSFSKIMTTDKLLYLFGSVSPKIALILSMALRYIPLYGQQIRKIRQAQQVIGLYKEDNAIDRIRGGLRIFSVMVSWALENGIITADSMTARGYGCGRRSRFAIFRWKKQDSALAAASVILGVIVIIGIAFGKIAYEWYPVMVTPGTKPLAIITYAAYVLLAFLPTCLQIKEESNWRSLQSGT